jgi:hypothetical protein
VGPHFGIVGLRMSAAERPTRVETEPATDGLPLRAYYREKPPRMRIVPAPRWRTWMNETALRNANRCLPLLTANEVGWALLNTQTFTAEWSGGDEAEALTVSYGDRSAPTERAVSIFGYGIVSFLVPYLFRTPPGWDLHVRGPANMPRDGIGPLEGMVETDWAVSTFTMNWKFTRPTAVTFEEGEPFCVLVPQLRRALESFVPQVRAAADDPEVLEGWEAFNRSRHDIQVRKFLSLHSAAHADAREAWEGDYFRGRTPDGRPAPEHITKRRLKPFHEA